MWEDIEEAERARRLREAEEDVPFLAMNLLEALQERNPDLALKILNAHARKGTREAYRATLDFCLSRYPKVVADWGLNDEQAAALIDVDQSTWELIKLGDRELSLHEEQLRRIPTLSLIYDRLHLFDHDFAIRWPTLSNQGELFGGRSPIEAMIVDGFTKMREVLAYIENLGEQH